MEMIKKVGTYKFQCIKGNLGILLNFEPFISANNLVGDYVVMHWNRLYRQYGYYCSTSRMYYVVKASAVSTKVIGQALEVELNDGTLPTACVVYFNSKLSIEGDNLTVEAKDGSNS